MATKIWLNRWFSTAYHFINMIRNNEDGREFVFYGTHPDLDTVYLQNCEVAESEPEVTGKEYIDFCLSFCQKHQIDIFIPRLHMIEISKHIEEFEAVGTKVLVIPDAKVLELLEDKEAFYVDITPKDIVAIPDYKVVTNVVDFEAAYLELASKGHRVCFKPVIGEGGNGFRVIDDSVDSIHTLYGSISHKISFAHAKQLLAQADVFPPIMVLEYLKDYEYSIDCLGYNGELYAAVPRKKCGGRVKYLEENKELIELARKITEEYKLSYIYNIQVKFNQGVPKLLEINTRMSGGLHLTCESGVNFPYLAVKLLMDKTIEKPTIKYDVKVTQLETPIVLSN